MKIKFSNEQYKNYVEINHHSPRNIVLFKAAKSYANNQMNCDILLVISR